MKIFRQFCLFIYFKFPNEKVAAAFSEVSITSMYFALERFEVVNHEKHLELLKNWRRYSRKNEINVFGKPKQKKSAETNIR